MKVRYALQTAWPTGVPNPERFDAVDWFQEGDIPFVPHAGLMIDCGDGDLREVDTVYWIANQPDRIELYFADENVVREFAYWASGGWETTDLVAPQKKTSRDKRRG
jgi:hypothetical protein